MNYTAKQIADALGKKRQSIQWHLRGIESAAVKVVNGNEAAAWALEQLPVELRQRLETEATRQHCRTVDVLLSMPRTRWQPPIPMDKIRDEDIQAATRLRTALLPWLYRQHDTRLTSAEMDAAGVEDYRRVFGNTIGTRHWREVFARTIRRDNGFEEWNRLEVYLPEKPQIKPAPAGVVSEALDDTFAELEQYLTGCGNPHDPSETERNGIWTLAIEKYVHLMGTGQTKKAAAKRVRQFLLVRAGFLASTPNALRVAFERKLGCWFSAGGDCKALRDGRENNGPEFNLPEDDRDLLIACATVGYFGCRGDVAPAWRNLIKGEKVPVRVNPGNQIIKKGFSATTMERYTAIPAQKSYVPAAVMESIAVEVEISMILQRGRRAWDAAKGHVERSYEGIHSMQCVSGDDFTMNTYFYIPNGKGWYELTRGQVILFIDFRSLKILGWALVPARNYSSLTIRSLCTHVFGEHGVPKVLYFERGIWKTAALLKGKTDPFTFAEISQGLREFNIIFKHAIRPRTKVVERIGGMFQDIAEAEPGYCGRDERRDAPESLRRQMAEVEARKVHPSKYFYSLDQWNNRIGQLVAKYNGEQQQGHILAGLSPDQAFEEHKDASNPPIQFSAGLRYLLAHDKRRLPVTLNGVTIQIGKQKFNYRGQEIAHLVGREVLAWFDPEYPETIVVTDLDRTNPICVTRSKNPNALESLIEPESGILENELSRIEGQASYMKTRFNVVKAKFPLPQRRMLAAAQVVELGEQIAEQKAQADETATRQQRRRSQAKRFAQRTGIAVSESAQENVRDGDASLIAKFLNGNDQTGQSGKETP